MSASNISYELKCLKKEILPSKHIKQFSITSFYNQLKRIEIMFMIKVSTIGKSFTTHKKNMELFNKYTLLNYVHNAWHNFYLIHKQRYICAL